MHHIKNYDFKQNFEAFCNTEKQLMFLGTFDKTTALIGNDDYDSEYCEQNDIVIVFSRNEGGNIINFVDDFNLALMGKEQENDITLKEIIRKFSAFLRAKNLTLEINGNDFMLGGYKVGSFAVKQLHRQNGERQSYIVIHFSVVADLEAIRAICRKEMKKVPKGLVEFGVTRAEIEEFILGLDGYEL